MQIHQVQDHRSLRRRHRIFWSSQGKLLSTQIFLSFSHRNFVFTGKFICKKEKNWLARNIFQCLCGNGYVRDALTQVCVRADDERRAPAKNWSAISGPVWLWKGTEKPSRLIETKMQCFLSFYVSLIKLRSPFWRKKKSLGWKWIWSENEEDDGCVVKLDENNNNTRGEKWWTTRCGPRIFAI